MSLEESGRWIVVNLPANRIQPLTHAEGSLASLHLNSLYLHMVGILDNFAWIFRCQIDSNLSRTIKRNEIGLFSKKIKNIMPDCEFKKEILVYSDWYTNMCEKRHQVAHRLPLYIPLKIHQSEDELSKGINLEKEYQKKQNELLHQLFDDPLDVSKQLSLEEQSNQFSKSKNRIDEFYRGQSEIQEEIDSLGVFIPCFIYPPKEDVIFPLYPIVTSDIINLDIVSNLCLSMVQRLCE